MSKLKWLLASPIILAVKMYQWFISPLFPPSCRYTPTCSSYMLEAVKEWGPIRGTWMGIKRIGTCHPRGGHGHDPVPKKEKN